MPGGQKTFEGKSKEIHYNKGYKLLSALDSFGHYEKLSLKFFVECHELLPIIQLNSEVTCTQARSQTKKRELISGVLGMAVGGVARPKAVIWAVIS